MILWIKNTERKQNIYFIRTDRKNTHVVPNRPNLITKFEYTDTQQDINGKDNKNHFNRAKMELNFLRKVNQPDEYSQVRFKIIYISLSHT
jgi:hypothetical protein